MALAVSVALCCRNGERFIAEQIQSILEQAFLPRQLVISDDASTDATTDIVSATIAAWRLANPGALLDVTLITNPVALGVTANFEGAIAATSGDLVALCDQDDVWPPHRVERMVTQFEARSDLLLLHTDAALINASGNPTGHSLFDALGVNAATKSAIHSGRAFEVLMKRNVVTGATTMFRRQVADIAAPFPSAWVHDEWLAIVAAAADGVDVLDEDLLGYRQHGANEIGVERLGLSGKAGRMLENGAERNRRLLRRSEQLVERISSLPASTSRIEAAREKLAHERVRGSLGRKRVARLAPVLREMTTGRYTRFGRGIADAARDLLQPL